MNNQTRTLAYAGMAIAVVCVTTMAVQIPVPQTRGYINMGDTMIFVSALLFGSKVGMAAGGLGSALADLLTGYALWAPFTLVIKGLEGFIVGWAGSRETGFIGRLPFLLLAAGQMAFGYFLTGSLLFGVGAALYEVPGNLFQGLSAVVIAPVIVFVLRKTEKTLLHRT